MAEISRASVEAAVSNAGLEEERDIRPDYSGRAMFGSTCFGIVYPSAGRLVRFIVELAKVDMPAAEALGANARTDNMGHDMIMYWPEVTLNG